MNHPEDIVTEIISALTTDTFTLVVGTKPEQNFSIDELDFVSKNGVVLLDTIGKIKWEYTLTNFRYANVPLGLFFAYKSKLDETTDSQLVPYVKKARLAADEFVLRLKSHDLIQYIDKNVSTMEVYNLFDLNLSGVYLEVTPKIKNADSSCLT